jgi:hypothetical protein
MHVPFSAARPIGYLTITNYQVVTNAEQDMVVEKRWKVDGRWAGLAIAGDGYQKSDIG